MSKSIYQRIKTEPETLVGESILYDYGNGDCITIEIKDSEYETRSVVIGGVITEFDIRKITSKNGIQYVIYNNAYAINKNVTPKG